MKIVHLSTYARGGAFIAAKRLHLSLLEQGVDSNLLVLHGEPDAEIKLEVYNHSSTLGDKITYALEGKRIHKQEAIRSHMLPGFDWFSNPEVFVRPELLPLLAEADVIHLHWVADFINWPTFFSRLAKKPIVWTFHDQNAYTGGCHYVGNCQQFIAGCHTCPQLESAFATQVANFYNTKRKALSAAKNLHIVAPSPWMRDQAAKSQILKNRPFHLLRYALPLDIFTPSGPNLRAKYGIGLEEKVILFVADSIANYRKGFSRLLQSLAELNEQNSPFTCLILGEAEPDALPQGSVRYQVLGKINFESEMAAAYRTANVFVIASQEDNYPNTILESIACGTPVVGYQATGIAEMIVPAVGTLADPEHPNSLGEAILRCLAQPWVKETLAAYATTNWAPSLIAQQHISLYASVCH